MGIQPVDRLRHNRATERALGRLWVRNLVRNYLRLEAMRSFSKCTTALPVILVGAGLSLERELPHIGRLAESHCVVAVDTALPVLRAHNIDPDLIVALDSQIYNVRDFLGGTGAHSIVAMDITTHPSLLRIVPPHRVVLFSSQFADIALLDVLARHQVRPLIVPALGSVGVSALHLCLTLTTREVYVVGIDFSYRMGKTHCRGAPFLTAIANTAHLLNPDPLYLFCASRAMVICRNKSGGNSVTEPPLIHSNRMLRELCAAHDRVYDCGDEGLHMTARRARLSELPRRPARKRQTRAPKITIGMQKDGHAAAASSSATTDMESGMRHGQTAHQIVVELHRRLNALLSRDPEEYAGLFADSESPSAALAELDFLALDRKGLPLAQHCRYSAMDYHHRLTRYLNAAL